MIKEGHETPRGGKAEKNMAKSNWKTTQENTLGFTGAPLRETQKAVLVSSKCLESMFGKGPRSQGWLPKSQCLINQEKGWVVIPAWLANKNAFCELAIEVETGINPKAMLRTRAW
jgi:hypothetical protein